MEMEDQYGMGDIRQLISNGGRALFAPVTDHLHRHQLYSGNRNILSQPAATGQNHHHGHHYELMMNMTAAGGGGSQDVSTDHHVIARGLTDFSSDSAANIGSTRATTNPSHVSSLPSLSGGFEVEAGGDGGTGRWPRQETLILLEIRSRLDPKFKEANQKGPLWDEVSRIMSEEHGYQRSGKKCREKFENLYKYYKKTKEGKSGRQDGKHYRFFGQLEALYGSSESTTLNSSSNYTNISLPDHQTHFLIPNPNTPNSQKQYDHDMNYNNNSLSLSNNSTEFDSFSSEDNDVDQREGSIGRSRRSWKVKIKEFIDSQMRKLIEKQEAWLEKLMKTLEQKEKERLLREEEWRKEQAVRIDKEHKFWAKERAWIEARDAALMEAFQKLDHHHHHNQNGGSNDHDRDPQMLNMNIYQRKPNNANRKRKENSRSCCINNNTNNNYHEFNSSCLYNSSIQGGGGGGVYGDMNEQGMEGSRMVVQQGNGGSNSPSSSNGNGAGVNQNLVQDGSFRFLMGGGDQADESTLWENYGLRLNNGDQN